jgi:hypothetical protein
MQTGLTFVAGEDAPVDGEPSTAQPESIAAMQGEPAPLGTGANEDAMQASSEELSFVKPPERSMRRMSHAGTLFAVVRESIQQILIIPMRDTEVAAALEVSTAQAKDWLQRLVDEGLLEKQKKPAGYVIKRKRLFEG